MSKKSRKRNKKILGALAAGLGAMALMKRRKTNALNAITAGDIVDTGSLSGKIGYEGEFPSASVVVPKKERVSTNFLAKPQINKMDTSEVDISDHYAPSINNKLVTSVINDKRAQKNIEKNRRKNLIAGNLVPPSMRGAARVAEGYQRKIPGQRHYPGGWTDQPGGWSNLFKKGGRVGCGKAKRGFGRALKKK